VRGISRKILSLRKRYFAYDIILIFYLVVGRIDGYEGKSWKSKMANWNCYFPSAS
jgi:hypothetical protein